MHMAKTKKQIRSKAQEPAEILRAAAAAAFLGLSGVATLYRILNTDKTFPLPVRLPTGRSGGWLRRELEAYIRELPRGLRDTPWYKRAA
jgi:predicted DNA-binding transcriptional regulator AlpA